MLIEKNKHAVFTLELILGIAFLIAVCFIILNTKIKTLNKRIDALQSNNEDKSDEGEAASKIKSVSPLALVILGVGATISELTTALPYFAFLAILFDHQLSFIELSALLLLYNTIYTLPLMILYFVYIKARDKFDRFYLVIKKQLTKWASVLAPSAVGIVGGFLVFHSIYSM